MKIALKERSKQITVRLSWKKTDSENYNKNSENITWPRKAHQLLQGKHEKEMCKPEKHIEPENTN